MLYRSREAIWPRIHYRDDCADREGSSSRSFDVSARSIAAGMRVDAVVHRKRQAQGSQLP